MALAVLHDLDIRNGMSKDDKSTQEKINERYFNGKLKINSIEYATDQNSRFGCCNCREASIRISHRLSRVPEWVRDCVIIHEMAHLIEPNHGPAFWNIVSHYELAERAKGYLMALGFDSDNEQDLENPKS